MAARPAPYGGSGKQNQPGGVLGVSTPPHLLEFPLTWGPRYLNIHHVRSRFFFSQKMRDLLVRLFSEPSACLAHPSRGRLICGGVGFELAVNG